MNNIEILSDHLKELRKKIGLKQVDFAKSIDIRQATYSAYEKGTNKPPIDVLIKIAERYSVSIDWLCGFSNNNDKTIPLNTCSDIFKILLELAALNGVRIDDDFSKSNGYRSGYDARYSKTMMLYFNDSTINNALQGWQKMKNLLNAGTIDQEVYDLWVEKTLKQLDIPYHADEDVINFLDSIPDEEELPFN